MANRTRSRKVTTIILSVSGILLLLAVIGLFSLPTIISTEWAAKKVKETVNAKIPGNLDFGYFSLSWFNGFEMRAITYDDRETGIILKVADITTTKSLLDFATDYKDIGAVNINNPVVYIRLKDRRKSAETATKVPATPNDEKATAINDGKVQAPQVAAQDAIALPIVAGRLNINDGSVITILPDAIESQVINDLDLQLELSELNNLLEYKLKFQSGDSKGMVNTTGEFSLPAGDLAALDEIQTQATIDVSNWQIANQLSILASVSDNPTGRGLLNGYFGVTGSMQGGLDIQGHLNAEQLHLSGGPLQTDSPSIDKVTIELDAQLVHSALTINKLALHSPLTTGTVTGKVDNQNKTEITSELIVDLAQLFTQFPATLKLKEGIKISKGQLELNTQVSQLENTITFDASARLDRLEGITEDKKLSLDKQITLLAKGASTPEGLELENFALESSFMSGTGQGNLNKMQVTVSADIGAALNEVQKFIELEEWQSAGKIDINLTVDTKAETLRAVTADVGVQDFVLKQKNNIIAPQSTVKANLATTLRVDKDMQPIEFVDTLLDYQTWIGSGAVEVESVVPPKNKAGVQITNLGFKGVIDLGKLTLLQHSLEALPQGTAFTGEAALDTTLSLREQKIDLGKTTLELHNLRFKRDKRQMSEKKIQISTSGEVDLRGKTVSLDSFNLESNPGQITFSEFLLTDWSKPEKSLKSNTTINLDLMHLSKSLTDFMPAPPKTDIDGKAEFKLNLDLTNKVQQVVQLDGNISNLKISSQDRQPLLEKSIQLQLDFSGDIIEQNVKFKKLNVSSAPATIRAKGSIAPDAQEHVLRTDGVINLDLQAISRYLKSLADMDIQMTGTGEKPFTITVVSTNNQWVDIPNKTKLSASFHADSIKGFGLLVESLGIPIELAKGKGEVDIQAKVNKGVLTVKPMLDFTVDQPVILLPENSPVLNKVGLTDDLSKDLLVHINPIFQGAAVSSGTVDLTMQHMNWPLDAAARKDGTFRGTLNFNEVKLQAGGLLIPLLEIMKVEKDEREIVLGDQPMEFVAENERIHCSPLSINVNEHSLLLSGSIGFDQSLDYKAQVPVTRKMVSGDVYKYLEGTSISVPIGGTASKPQISKDVVQVALKDLILQAGRKQVEDQAGKLLQKLFE